MIQISKYLSKHYSGQTENNAELEVNHDTSQN